MSRLSSLSDAARCVGVLVVLLASGAADAQDAPASADPPADLPVDTASDAAAEAPASADPIVHAILVEAVAEYEAGHYAEAQALFRRASALAPSGRTLRGLGMASYELRQYATAIVALEQAQAATERPLTDAQRAHVADLLARARGFVAHVRFALAPADAALRVDGVLTALDPESGVLLDPGRHLVVVEHEGYDTETLDVSLEPGVSRDLAITLAPHVTPPPPPPPPGDADALGWAGAGLGIAAVLTLAASAATGIVALTDQEQLARECRGFVCSGSAIATRDRARDLSIVTDVLGAAAAALGTTAVSLALVAALQSPPGAPEVGVACTDTGCVATVRGRF